MCGIVGYINNYSSDAIKVLLDGIKRLEYRGYDSAGLAILTNDSKIHLQKSIGKVNELAKKIDKWNFPSQLGIIHTRWATHGGITETNAHPHSDCSSKIQLVHNGIIENYTELRDELRKKGHKIDSQTDTAVIAHLIEEYAKKDFSFENACRKAIKRLRGSYALAIISEDYPDLLIGARLGSPLLLGITKYGFLLASDQFAVSPYTKDVVYLDDQDFVVLKKKDHKFEIQEVGSGKKHKYTINKLDKSNVDVDKQNFSHFMLKEIYEIPQAVRNAISGRIKNNHPVFEELEKAGFRKKLSKIDKIMISACGTAYYAGLYAEHLFEELLDNMPSESRIASEFRYRNMPIDKKTLFIVISQSGETADTISALNLAKGKGAFTIGLVNVMGSTIAREVDIAIYNYAGPEIGVASTKAFVSQLTVLVLLAVWMRGKNQLQLVKELKNMPLKIEKTLELASDVKQLAEKYKNAKNFLFLGRKYSYPVALEGSLKLKEISYVHAEGYAAGEMKHGPIALIDKDFPSVFIAPKDSIYEKTISNMEETKARGGPIIAVTTKGETKILDIATDILAVPETLEQLTPFITVVPLQLFAYYMGVLKGYDVDKPRNLAKSVTVE